MIVLSVSLVLWVRSGSLMGECDQFIPCTVGVTRESTGECDQCIPFTVGVTRKSTG